jgi:hypothetical protein
MQNSYFKWINYFFEPNTTSFNWWIHYIFIRWNWYDFSFVHHDDLLHCQIPLNPEKAPLWGTSSDKRRERHSFWKFEKTELHWLDSTLNYDTLWSSQWSVPESGNLGSFCQKYSSYKRHHCCHSVHRISL